MNILKRLFTKKKEQTSNEFALMGTLGISPQKMLSYQDSLMKLKAYESSNKQ